MYIQKCKQVFSYLTHPLWEALSGNVSLQAGEVGPEEPSREDYTTKGGKAYMLGVQQPFPEVPEVPCSPEYTLLKEEPELTRVGSGDLFHLLTSSGLGSPQEILLVVLIENIKTYRTMDYKTQEAFATLCGNIKVANDILESDFFVSADEIIKYISLWPRMGNLNEIEVPEHLHSNRTLMRLKRYE